MTSDIHLTGTTHCPERVFTTHNSTPHERKIGTQNMTAKGIRNATQNILINIGPFRYSCASYHSWLCLAIVRRSYVKRALCSRDTDFKRNYILCNPYFLSECYQTSLFLLTMVCLNTLQFMT